MHRNTPIIFQLPANQLPSAAPPAAPSVPLQALVPNTVEEEAAAKKRRTAAATPVATAVRATTRAASRAAAAAALSNSQLPLRIGNSCGGGCSGAGTVATAVNPNPQSLLLPPSSHLADPAPTTTAAAVDAAVETTRRKHTPIVFQLPAKSPPAMHRVLPAKQLPSAAPPAAPSVPPAAPSVPPAVNPNLPSLLLPPSSHLADPAPTTTAAAAAAEGTIEFMLYAEDADGGVAAKVRRWCVVDQPFHTLLNPLGAVSRAADAATVVLLPHKVWGRVGPVTRTTPCLSREPDLLVGSGDSDSLAQCHQRPATSFRRPRTPTGGTAGFSSSGPQRPRLRQPQTD